MIHFFMKARGLPGDSKPKNWTTHKDTKGLLGHLKAFKRHKSDFIFHFYENNYFVYMGLLQIFCSKNNAQCFLASVTIKVVMRQLKNTKCHVRPFKSVITWIILFFIGHIWYLPPFGGIYVPCWAWVVNGSRQAVNIKTPWKTILFTRTRSGLFSTVANQGLGNSPLPKLHREASARIS